MEYIPIPPPNVRHPAHQQYQYDAPTRHFAAQILVAGEISTKMLHIFVDGGTNNP